MLESKEFQGIVFDVIFSARYITIKENRRPLSGYGP